MISKIKILAHELGFDQVGITRPETLQAGEAAIRQWVAEGRHGSMKYLEDFSQRRQRFFENFPDAKSVIVLGVNYFSQEPRIKSAGVSGRVARYAWGKDYHKVIQQKHEILIERLREMTQGELEAKSCVDTQPVPERFAAVQAGLGFLGKHTGLLSAQFGPWLFLSEIVTNLELEEDLPAAGDCGTCDHCQKVCPTGALDQDYKMDARLCIAYWTIEHKGVIPREMRPKIKDWIFGCDECLAICPFTSKSRETRWPELGPASGTGEWLGIEDLFAIKSNKTYERKFRESALSRGSRKQMLRNACIVLGNSGRPEALDYLRRALKDESHLVRLHAAWGLGRLGHPDAKKILQDREKNETDLEVKTEIRWALAAGR